MTTVPIYNSVGQVVDKLEIDDDLQHVNGRVSKGKEYYYKGAGAPYHGQFLDSNPIVNTYGYDVVDFSDVFYMGPYARKWAFNNKSGIFQEKYQPQFTDFIGSCGVKELSIIENSEEFDLSSVKVIKAVNYDKDNQQYYFVLNYKCDRIKYLELGEPSCLYMLLEYMIKNDWNFIWDKTSIEDISYNGLVSDVGDIFKSGNLGNKLGTVYSVLYSLGKLSPDKYAEFLRECKLDHNSDMYYIDNSISLLHRFGVDVRALNVGDRIANYKNAVLNYLVTGRNCGDCCYIELGDKIREQYLFQTKRQLLVD
jgi:hypothetical protein